MPDHSALINFGELSKPATVLIEKVSDAVGGVFRPHQIRRVAQAEADAEKIRAIANIEISDLQRRAFERFVREEAKKQENIEAITSKALPAVDDKSDPAKMGDDWITHFFDKARLISDDEMQQLWAKVLAGEANSPGKFSKRTVSFLASLDKTDAEAFLKVCSFSCHLGGAYPLIYDVTHAPYRDAGLTFVAIQHLEDIGLISFDGLAGFTMTKQPKRLRVSYYGHIIDLEFQKDTDNELSMGMVLLSKVGRELATVCDPKAVDGFTDYLITKWLEEGIVCSSPVGARPAA